MHVFCLKRSAISEKLAKNTNACGRTTTHHSEIPPYLILNSLSGNVSKKTVCTAATRVLAYEGVANGMNAELIVTFWCQIANKVKAYVAEKHISFINFPSGTDIKLGIANPCLADITSKTFPSIYLWMAERMPKPRPIKSRLHTLLQNPTLPPPQPPPPKLRESCCWLATLR